MQKSEENDFLKEYDINKYERPSVAADIVIFSIFEEEAVSQRKMAEGKLSILLIRRKEHPFKNCWALPGGFWRKNETMEECAARELEEETGLKKAKLVPVGAFSKPGRDPRGWILSNAYMAPVYRADVRIKAGDDAAEACWFTIDYDLDTDKKVWKLKLTSQEHPEEIRLNATLKEKVVEGKIPGYEIKSSDGIAFDHPEIMISAIKLLKNHLSTDYLAYDFLPEKFTFMQLQKLHEIILEQPLLAANFRRKTLNEIEETGEMLEGKAFRPAMLYRRKV